MTTASSPDFDTLVVHGSPPSAEERGVWDHDPLVRAYGIPTWGGTPAITYLRGPAEDVALRENTICPDDAGCVHYLMVMIGRVIPSAVAPRAYNQKAMLEVTPGFLTAIVRNFEALQPQQTDVETAGALLFGNGPYDLLVEVVGDDQRRVADVLLQLTDLQGVKSISHHVFLVGGTGAWGA